TRSRRQTTFQSKSVREGLQDRRGRFSGEFPSRGGKVIRSGKIGRPDEKKSRGFASPAVRVRETSRGNSLSASDGRRRGRRAEARETLVGAKQQGADGFVAGARLAEQGRLDRAAQVALAT